MVLTNPKGGGKYSYFLLIIIPIHNSKYFKCLCLVQGEDGYNHWYIILSDKKVDKTDFL